MDNLIKAIERKLTVAKTHLTIVRNPDGFLLRPDVQQRVLNGCRLLLLPVSSSIQLRVRYELVDKQSTEHVCYVTENQFEVLPDMLNEIHALPVFSLSDLMLACNETELRQAAMTFNMASYIYDKHYTYNLTPEQTRMVLNEAVLLYGEDPSSISDKLRSVKLEWDKVETIDAISKILYKAIQQNSYLDIEGTINELNADFQKYLDERYFSLANTSHVNKPKMVNKVLPHLAYRHGRTDKVSLVVIDGMTYWQYLILHRELESLGLNPHKDCTFAWLPSITKLSRQAIFRGDAPQQGYSQNPSHESELWTEFWTNYYDTSKRLNTHEVAYSHASLQIADSCRYKQAFVDVTLDEVMHHLPSNKDLFDVTENWAKDAAKSILDLHNQGFTVYITTDHGNVYSHGWRNLFSQEKTFLYKDESRGKRHLIYQDDQALYNFVDDNIDVGSELLVRDKWLVWRTSKCFKNQDIITHGGAHFLEVIIPFVTIEK